MTFQFPMIECTAMKWIFSLKTLNIHTKYAIEMRFNPIRKGKKVLNFMITVVFYQEVFL